MLFCCLYSRQLSFIPTPADGSCIDFALQVRLIVWRAKDVVAKDGVEQPTAQEVKEGADPTPTSSSCFGCCSCCGGSSGSSDVYITAQFEGMDDKKETDVGRSWWQATCASADLSIRSTGAALMAVLASTGE